MGYGFQGQGQLALVRVQQRDRLNSLRRVPPAAQKLLQALQRRLDAVEGWQLLASGLGRGVVCRKRAEKHQGSSAFKQLKHGGSAKGPS